MNQKAIIVDVDGTLAKKSISRGYFEYHLAGADLVYEDIAEIVRFYARSPLQYAVLICSGREDSSRQVLIDWLDNHDIPWHELFMREAGDFRRDAIIKREIWENQIKDNYEIRIVLDDRNQVVEMWRELGLRVLQVAPGNF